RHAGIATMDTPAAAAEAVSLLTRWSELRMRLDRVPSSSGEVPSDRSAAAAQIEIVAAEGRTLLTEPEAKAVLSAYSIPVPRTLIAATEDEVVRYAETLLAESSDVVVKVLSRTVSHKSDLGGVVLGLTSAPAAGDAAAMIRQRFIDAGHNGEALD